MALRADSYGTVAEVRALTRHLLDGAFTFDEVTRPTLADVERIIDRASASLNLALIREGLTVPITDAVAGLAAADWVVRRAAADVELTQRGAGWNDEENGRFAALRLETAVAVAAAIAASFRAQGSGDPTPAHAGLSFTGTSVAIFTRGQFDYP